MMQKKPWWNQPGFRIGAVLILLMLVGGAAAAIYYTQAAPDQPIQFPHDRHVGMGAPACTAIPSGHGPNRRAAASENMLGLPISMVQKNNPN